MAIFRSTSAQVRSSTSHSIRGKISGPIPLSNSLDDEFPFQNTGSGVPPPVDSSRYPGLCSRGGGGDRPVSESPPSPRLVESRNADTTPSPPQRTMASSMTTPNPDPVRFSGISFASRSGAGTSSGVPAGLGVTNGPSSSQGQGRDLPQRKKSTLRTTLGRLFGGGRGGRRKKDGFSSDLIETRIPESPGAPPSPRRSDPPTLKRDVSSPEDETKRSNSLPITEYDRALRSHSIGPDDLNAIESVRNSLQTELSFSRRRAATAGTRIPVYPRPREIGGEPAGLSPRPATTHAHARGGSRALHLEEEEAEEEEEDPAEIGRAITSDGQQLPVQHKRRSRSLSGLPHADQDRSGTRRRSDEIRYWRESYDPGYMSPVSSNGPDADADADAAVTLPEIPPPPARTSDNSKTALPKPYNFSAVGGGGGVPTDGTGFKITEVASLATRLCNLEDRVQKLERSLSRIQPLDLTTSFDSVPLPPTPRDYKSTQESGPSSPLSPDLSDTARLSFEYVDPSYPVSLSPGPPQKHVSAPRPNSNTTLRGAASLPSLTVPRNANSLVSGHQYNSLLELIQHERSERRELVVQLHRLERRFTLFNGISTAAGHHLPGDADPDLEPPPTAKSFGERSVFECDAEAQRNLSGKGHDRHPLPEDSDVITHSTDDEDEHSEEYRTPREERPPPVHAYGAFGEELRETPGGKKKKKTARTLSMSQLQATEYV